MLQTALHHPRCGVPLTTATKQRNNVRRAIQERWPNVENGHEDGSSYTLMDNMMEQLFDAAHRARAPGDTYPANYQFLFDLIIPEMARICSNCGREMERERAYISITAVHDDVDDPLSPKHTYAGQGNCKTTTCIGLQVPVRRQLSSAPTILLIALPPIVC
jgi:hypothetical protein